jgi:hypothetical protein
MAEHPYARSLALVSQPVSQPLTSYPVSRPAGTSVWQTYRELIAPSPTPVQTPMQSAVTGLRHNAEGAVVGAVLGYLEGKLGTLDIGGKYPVDGIAAFLLYLLSIRDAGKPDGFASDVRAVSQSLTTIAFYRKVKEAASPSTVEDKDNMPRHKGPVSTSKDPILAAAEKLGLGSSEKAA